MRYKIFFAAVFTTVFLEAPFAQINKGRNSKSAIICLTYDDGLETQLRQVLPQLDSIGLKATFFLNSIQGSSQSNVIGQTPEAVLGWSKAATDGHELANHTLFHPCPEKFGWERKVAIDSYTVDKIIEEITTQNAILSLLDPKRKTRSFAFPCNNVFVGSTDYSKIIKDRGLVQFGRAGGDSNSIITNFSHLNTMQVPSWHVWTGTTLQQLISFAEKVKKAGGMGVYQIHGVGGQVFQISSETHKAFVGYLKDHQDEYWITTFSEAMEFITSARKPTRSSKSIEQ
jgi:peptidoglycan/xylan/chitin deacetylase (PgdA/CDA1 family)